MDERIKELLLKLDHAKMLQVFKYLEDMEDGDLDELIKYLKSIR